MTRGTGGSSGYWRSDIGRRMVFVPLYIPYLVDDHNGGEETLNANLVVFVKYGIARYDGLPYYLGTIGFFCSQKHGTKKPPPTVISDFLTARYVCRYVDVLPYGCTLSKSRNTSLRKENLPSS